MKKSLLALAALTAFAGVASAQSSVTLFGGVDLAVRSQKMGSAGTVKSITQDGIYSSRFGIRGVEDLGGGLRALFWYEAGVNPDIGCGQGPAVAGANAGEIRCGGLTFQRLSFIGLAGGFGEVHIGREYTPRFSNEASWDPFGNNGIGNNLNGISSLGSGSISTVRANNSILYILPAMGGLYGSAMIATGENATGNKYTGGRLGYAAGPVNVGGAYGVAKKTGTMVNDLKELNVGASFDMGFMKLMGQFNRMKSGGESQKMIQLGTTVPLGAGLLRAAVSKYSGDSATAALADQYDARLVGIGYIYNLSKRTAVYGTYGNMNNGGTTTSGALFTFNAPANTTAGQANSPAASGLRRGETVSGFELGLRHIF